MPICALVRTMTSRAVRVLFQFVHNTVEVFETVMSPTVTGALMTHTPPVNRIVSCAFGRPYGVQLAAANQSPLPVHVRAVGRVG